MSVFLSVLFCLHLVNSCLGDNTLLESYKKNLTLKREMEDDKEVLYFEYDRNGEYYEICEKPREMRAAICRHVIRRLRKKSIDNKYYKDYKNFYMNYLAFTIGEPCQTIRVWIDQGYIFAHQTVINCFARSAIMSYEISEETTHLFQDIVIYPHTNVTFFIFEYKQDRNYYKLLDKYEIYQWYTIKTVSNLLFTITMPQSYSQVSNLFEILFPIYSQLKEYSQNTNNIVNFCDKETFSKICYVAFKCENYKKKFNWSRIKKPLPKLLQASLRRSVHELNLPVSILAYSCEYSVVLGDRFFMSQYYIAAGPGNYSVILLQEMSSNNNGNPHYEIIEFVNFMTENYISSYFQHSY